MWLHFLSYPSIWGRARSHRRYLHCETSIGETNERAGFSKNAKNFLIAFHFSIDRVAGKLDNEVDILT